MLGGQGVILALFGIEPGKFMDPARGTSMFEFGLTLQAELGPRHRDQSLDVDVLFASFA